MAKNEEKDTPGPSRIPKMKIKRSLLSRSPRHYCPTVCAVCGAKSYGYHYEAPACTACKSFFRRVVLSQVSYSCSREGTCVIHHGKNMGTFCRACRFNKCVSVGMNPHGIRTVDDLDSNSVVQGIIERKSSDSSLDTISGEDETQRLINDLLGLEQSSKKSEQENKLFSSLKEYLERGDVDMMEENSPDEHVEQIRLWDTFLSSWHSLGITCQLSDLYEEIDYVLKLEFFEKLEVEDQQMLLKQGILTCFNATRAFLCSRLVEEEKEPTSPSISVNLFAEKMRVQVIDTLKKNETDKKEFILLKAIILCNSAMQEISPEGSLSLEIERKKFSSALLTYCLSLDPSSGPARFASNLVLVNSISKVTNYQKDLLFLAKMNMPNRDTYGLLDELID